MRLRWDQANVVDLFVVTRLRVVLVVVDGDGDKLGMLRNTVLYQLAYTVERVLYFNSPPTTPQA